ncbi:MAG TPA: GDSL-type esterase/lipase family protein, partial [Acidobacteriota bacterium]|nr:GDSL-type esterase/lipase family protein [Acidobacteriota bacterium]
SSITQGFASLHLGAAHLSLATHRLGIDFLNLGFGGSCHAEPALIEYLATRADWHVGWLELGANMIGGKEPFSDAAFAQRARFAVEQLSASPARPLFVTTLYPGTHDLPGAPRAGEPWREIIREVVRSIDRPHVHLVEGERLLAWSGLSADLCHPSDVGHAQMAAAAEEQLSPVISALRLRRDRAL